MSKRQIIGGFVGFFVFLIPIIFIIISLFNSGFSQIVGMVLLFLCLLLLMNRNFKELGAEFSKVKFWFKKR